MMESCTKKRECANMIEERREDENVKNLVILILTPLFANVGFQIILKKIASFKIKRKMLKQILQEKMKRSNYFLVQLTKMNLKVYGIG